MKKMKKNVYLVQVSAIYGEEDKSVYIPYAIGSLAAYAWANEKIREHYKLGRFVCVREKIDEAIDSLDNPYLVGFSSYVWNMEYNKEFAKRLKARYPECIIMFGGHNVLPNALELKQNSFIDILVHGEGEISFKELLLALMNGTTLKDIQNISYRNGENKLITTKKSLAPDVTGFPSPYLGGYFDELLKTENISFSLIWETNRGCPHCCTYCDWGELKSKVRKFPMERLKAEIEWMKENRIEYIYCADANFGIFDRDEEIVDLIVKSKLDCGYPQKFKTNFTKGRDEFVIRIGKKLMDYEIGKSPTLSFQSLNPEVLKNIGRVNMGLDHFKSLMALYTSINVPVYSELILGLPGETYESFAKGLCTLLECCQHKSIGVYPCELLPNSLLADPAYMAKHGIVAKKIPFSQYHCNIEDDEIQEFTKTIIATNTMGIEDWKKSYMFSIFIQGLHNLGLTRVLAIYLYYEKNIKYCDFYEKLISWFEDMDENSICNQEYRLVKKLTHGVTVGKNAFTCVFEGFGSITWGFEEHVFLNFARNLDQFIDELYIFMKTFNIEEDVLENLIKFQKGIVRKLDISNVKIPLDYDFFNYFQDIYINEYSPLKKRSNTLIFEDKQPTSNWEDYAKINVWYGRRDDYPLYTGNTDLVTVKYS